LWLALPLVAVVLLAGLVGHTPASQALTPLATGVTKTVDPESILPGQTPAPLYTVTFSNPATTTLILDWITDTLPTGFLFVSMDPSSGWLLPPVDTTGPDIVWQGPITVPAASTLSLVYSIYVPASVPRSPIPYVNSVIATSGQTTIGPATAGLLVGAADMSVTKAAAPTRLLPGQTTDYTVTFANSGELTGTLTVISDTLDPSLTFVQMLPGSDVTDPPDQVGDTLVWTGPFILPVAADLVLKYQVDTSTEPGWHYPCNEAAALAGDEQVGPARICVEVGPAHAYMYLPVIIKDVRWAQFTIAKSVTPTEVDAAPGQVVTYTVTIANVGDEPGKLAAVVDTLPDGFTYLDMAPGSDVTADPTGTTGLIRWAGPFNIAGGGQLRLIYKVTANQAPGQYTNSANVEAMVGRPPAGPASAVVTVRQSILLQDNFDGGIGADWIPFLNLPSRLEEGQWHWDATAGVGGTGGVVHTCCLGTGKRAADAVMMYLGAGAEQWTNYRIEAKMLLTGGYDADGIWGLDYGDPIGLWVRGQYEPSDTRGQWMTGYYVVINGKSTRPTHLVRLAQLQTAEDCTTACDNPANLYKFDNPYVLLEVEVPGGYDRNVWYTLTVEVRGNRIIVWENGQQVMDYTDDKFPFMEGTVGFKTHESWDAMFDEITVTQLP
jgi:uncharacterized repeat protein (TIGR01451 family)